LLDRIYPGRSCRTGFIREGVGSVSGITRACPGLLANEFAPKVMALSL
jgi:hypothetical protein